MLGAGRLRLIVGYAMSSGVRPRNRSISTISSTSTTSGREPEFALVERGVFGSLALHGGNVLELCCGDGFNAKHFYSLRSRQVLACDFDPGAIAHARRTNAAPNVTYVVADIRKDIPDDIFENVAWDGAIEHFTPDEIALILVSIKQRLRPTGILSGYTIVERPTGKSLHHYEYEFKSKEDLATVLRPHFARVTVFETIYPDRHNLYSWASDGPVPFDPDWSQSRRQG